jgi:hypothetical protein
VKREAHDQQRGVQLFLLTLSNDRRTLIINNGVVDTRVSRPTGVNRFVQHSIIINVGVAYETEDAARTAAKRGVQMTKPDEPQTVLIRRTSLLNLPIDSHHNILRFRQTEFGATN